MDRPVNMAIPIFKYPGIAVSPNPRRTLGWCSLASQPACCSQVAAIQLSVAWMPTDRRGSQWVFVEDGLPNLQIP